MAKWKIVREENLDGYLVLKRKVFINMLVLVIVSLFGLIALYVLFGKGRTAETVVRIIWFMTDMSYEDALMFYHMNIRSNADVIIYFISAITFFVIFRLLLGWFTKYFGEINHGLDALINRDGKKIELSKEMRSMENKLNSVRETLEQQFDEIQQAEQKKDELVMYLAHDIRTPLTSVIGYLKLMEEMPGLSEEQRVKFLQITMEKAERLEVLINEFFDITRYGKQTIEISKDKIDLYYMLAQMVEEVFPALEEQGKHIKLHVPEDCGVHGDPDKLARVFQNLLKNAIAYSSPQSTITIGAMEDERDTTVWVSNQGTEVPRENFQHLFDKFYRIDDARQSYSGGAGLGLAIAKELVEMHGGTIEADGEGDIITFTVILPK